VNRSPRPASVWRESAWRAALATLRAVTWRRLEPGVTIVTVNWNTAGYLRTYLDAVRRFSPATTRLVVVDNHSSDDSWQVLRAERGLTRLRLPRNVGHGGGLDVGVSVAKTQTVVTLDVDAFPITGDWLQTLVRPLDEGYVLVGANAFEDFAHPSMLATQTRWLAGRSFRPDMAVGLHPGMRLTLEADGPVKLLPVTERCGPHTVGSVYGDIVYHNFFSAHPQSAHSRRGGDQAVDQRDVQRAWDAAVSRFLVAPRP
jgi:glycosyltransferase involved in cell wall biosynthesis